MKWRPFGYHFEDGWRPIIKLSVVSSNIDSNNFGLRKMALLYLNLASLSLIFNLYKVYKNQNYNLSNIKEYSIIVCWKAEFCSFSYEMLRISKGKETFALKGDHFEDNWRPNIKLSVVSRIIGCNIFGLRKMALLFLYLPFCLQFAIFKKYIKPKW